MNTESEIWKRVSAHCGKILYFMCEKSVAWGDGVTGLPRDTDCTRTWASGLLSNMLSTLWKGEGRLQKEVSGC
jgi:hypothetical protein